MLQRRRIITHANAKSKSEKFPPPHQDGAVGFTHHIDSSSFVDPPGVPFSSMNFSYAKEPIQTWSGPLVEPTSVASFRRKSKQSKKDKNSVRTKERESIII